MTNNTGRKNKRPFRPCLPAARRSGAPAGVAWDCGRLDLRRRGCPVRGPRDDRLGKAGGLSIDQQRETLYAGRRWCACWSRKACSHPRGFTSSARSLGRAEHKTTAAGAGLALRISNRGARCDVEARVPTPRRDTSPLAAGLTDHVQTGLLCISHVIVTLSESQSRADKSS
jgi:hypothetical protein